MGFFGMFFSSLFVWPFENDAVYRCLLLIPMKVIIDSDMIPVTGSEVKLIVFGAKRRWRSYPA